MNDEDLIKQAVIDAGIPITEAEIKAEFETLAEAAGVPVKNNSPYSAFWRFVSEAFSKPFVAVIGFMMITIMRNVFLKTATGVWLELFAYRVDLTKKLATKLTGQVKISRLDSSGDVDILTDRVIQSPLINGKTYKVLVTEDYVFTDGSAEIIVNVESEAVGKDFNLGVGFYSVLEEPIPGWTVTNESDWLLTPGTDDEEDDDLRDRCRLQFANVASWHTDSTYKSIIASFDGVSVSDIYFAHNEPRGPGSADAFIDFEAGSDPSALVTSINTFIDPDGNHGLGDDLKVFPLPEENHNLVFNVVSVSTLSGAQKATLQTNIEYFVKNAFGETNAYGFDATKIKPNSTFFLDALCREIGINLPGIKSIVCTTSSIVTLFVAARVDNLTVNVS